MSDHAGEPAAPVLRTFSLKSPEAYDAMCPRPDRPWIPNGALPREPRPRDEADGVWVSAEDEDVAGRAFGDWLAHVQAGRIG
jgi:hypothetical protein